MEQHKNKREREREQENGYNKGRETLLIDINQNIELRKEFSCIV